MIPIPLTRGMFAIVDDQDADLLDVKWCARTRGTGDNARHSAVRVVRKNGNRANERMHRVILERMETRGLFGHELCDHIDHNGLNNCRNNLRIATYKGNTANRRKNSGKTSKYKGVSWNSYHKKWRAVAADSFLGYFTNEEDAAMAYDRKAKELFGEFCYANFQETCTCRYQELARLMEETK